MKRKILGKTLIYRVIATISRFLILFIIFNDFSMTITIWVTLEVVGLIRYFLFELMWEKCKSRNSNERKAETLDKERS